MSRDTERMQQVQQSYLSERTIRKNAGRHVRYNPITHNWVTYTCAALFGLWVYFLTLREDSQALVWLNQVSDALVRLGNEGPVTTLVRAYHEWCESGMAFATRQNILAVVFALLAILVQIRVCQLVFRWLTTPSPAGEEPADEQEAQEDEPAEVKEPAPEPKAAEQKKVELVERVLLTEQEYETQKMSTTQRELQKLLRSEEYKLFAAEKGIAPPRTSQTFIDYGGEEDKEEEIEVVAPRPRKANTNRLNMSHSTIIMKGAQRQDSGRVSPSFGKQQKRDSIASGKPTPSTRYVSPSKDAYHR